MIGVSLEMKAPMVELPSLKTPEIYIIIQHVFPHLKGSFVAPSIPSGACVIVSCPSRHTIANSTYASGIVIVLHALQIRLARVAQTNGRR